MVNGVKPGSQYQADKDKGFNLRTPASPITKKGEVDSVKIEAMKIAAIALSNIPVPNVADHARKVIEMSEVFESHIRKT